ncbi:hypothetical protein MKW92_019617 [Papaver armeniacum]|nr:hypothetical protein MKW92_019617 [Papaver armeniacum]
MLMEEDSTSIGPMESLVADTPLNLSPAKSLDDISEFNSGYFSSYIAGLDNGDSGSSKAPEVNQFPQSNSPICTPTSDFFAQALIDKNKEAVVIQFMKERYMPAIEMIKAVNDVSGMGVEGDIADLIRLLIKSAIKKPEVFNFECREANPGV